MNNKIRTQRLDLIPCDQDLFSAILKGDDFLSGWLGLEVPPNWTKFGCEPIYWSSEQLRKDPENSGWLTYLPVYRKENKLIGSCGYKGKPDEQGVVEIGYEIAKEYRNQGLATEIARALIQNAFLNKNVCVVQAHTVPDKNASVKVLLKSGMKFIGEVRVPEEGKVWLWKLNISKSWINHFG